MDTHVTTDPVLDDSSVLRARLPGEPDGGLSAGDAVPPLHAEKREASPSPPKRRSGLLSGVAIIAVVVIAGGGFLVSPYNTVVPVPPGMKLAALHAEAQVVALFRHPAAPKAQVAETTPVAPTHAAGTPSPTPATAPASVMAPSAALAPIHAPAPPPTVVQPPYKAVPQTAEMAELVDLQPGALAPAGATVAQQDGTSHPKPALPKAQPPLKGASQPVSIPPAHSVAIAQPEAPPAGYVPREPGSASGAASVSSGMSAKAAVPSGSAPPPNAEAEAKPAVPGAKAIPATAKIASAEAPPPVPSVQPLHTVAVGPGDVLAISPKLQAAPMAAPQQIQVLELVTQLATLIRDQKTQIANLQADVQTNQKATTAKLSDFERRLALVEAGTALAAASGAPAPSPTSATATQPAPAATTVALTSAKAALAAASAPPAAAPAPTPAPPNTGAPEQYRVQAASPGLAMLAEVDHSGGDDAQQEVQVGDTLPGYGRVLSVSQQGTAWVVKTEHGTIQ